MAYRFFKRGNYLYIRNDVDELLIDGSASNFEIVKDLNTDTNYSILKNGIDQLGGEKIDISDIADENGNAFADFDQWKEENTGFNAASGGSGAGIPIQSHRFLSIAARDTYFTANPTELRTGLPIFVRDGANTLYQIWAGGAQQTYVPANDAVNWAAAGTFAGTALQIKTLNESNADTNPLIDTDLAKLNAITDTGRGQIITTTEATNIGNSFSAAAVNEQNITLTRNSGTNPAQIAVPVGLLSIADVEVTASFTINVAGLSTYRNRTVINRAAGANDIVCTLEALNVFQGASTTDFFITFVNESDTNNFLIRTPIGNTIAQNTNTITLDQGQSITIKYARSGNIWLLVASSVPSTSTAGGTLPQPDPAGRVIIQAAQWDPSTGSFPSGGSAGALYIVSTTATIDNQTFRDHDLLLQLVDNASTTTIGTDWRRINGDEYLVTWAGLTGVVDDNAIATVLQRIGFELVSPSVHNFSTDLPARVDLNTNLNISVLLTYDISNRNSVQGFELLVTGGDNKTLVLPTRDGVQSQSVALTGITTAAQTTITLQLQITDTNGITHLSNSVSVAVRNLTADEFAYYGVRPTNDFATVDLALLTRVDVTNSGSSYTINEQAANGEILGILSPDNRDPDSILDVLGQESRDDFTPTIAVRTENSTPLNLLTLINNSGVLANFNFAITTE